MKRLVLLGLIALAFSCSSEKKKTGKTSSKLETSESPVTSPVLEENQEENDQQNTQSTENYIELPDSSYLSMVVYLEKKYASVPYFFLYQDEPFFIVSTGNGDDIPGKSGMVDSDMRLLLETEFDKVYNPDVTLLHCNEVKRGEKMGLFNYAENDLLEPQFDYIVPEADDYSKVAFGIKQGDWYRIEYQNQFKISRCDYDLIQRLNSLEYSTSVFQNTPLLNIDVITRAPEHPLYSGSGVAITPSHIERLGIVPDITTDLILKGDNSDFGLDELSVSRISHSSISNKLATFIVRIYESNFNARGYIDDEKALIVLDNKTKEVESQMLNSISKEYLCREENIVHINDTLVEVQSTQTSGILYNWESNFSYYAILPSGKVEQLASNRNFDASKFTQLEERHFIGCFGKYMTQEERDELNNEDSYLTVWRSDHLSIEDLDIMRNEIFAEYGYRFNTEKWRNYFDQFDWYHPRYDNVDDQLTQLDKANIKTILELKERMLDKEQEFTKKKAVGYSEAG